MTPNNPQSALGHTKAGGPVRIGEALIMIRRGADAIRTVRTAILELAYEVASELRISGYLVLEDSGITENRVRAEWERAAAVLKGDILNRLTICLERDGKLLCVPQEVPREMAAAILKAVGAAGAGGEAQTGARARSTRPDYSFVILKVLIYQWLIESEAVTAERLGRIAGCSYPTVARVLKQFGSLIERSSDRRVRLRYFPREEFDRLVANSERARSTIRFADRSGQPRTPEARVRRLEKLRPAGVAIGGVLGARHYFAEIDLVGTPRLDVSVHCGHAAIDLSFINDLDPALRREEDPHKPASVVVHAVRHADPLFVPRQSGLAWADPVECLLDLREARLESQASEFLETLKRRQKSAQ